MFSPRRDFLRGALAASAAAALPACTPAGLDFSAPRAFVERKDKDGEVELILNAVDVWDAQGASDAAEFSIDGKTLWFRPRPAGMFEQAWMRAGLFWHSRQKRIIITAVALGPKVTIRKLRLDAGGSVAEATPAKNFTFTPAKRALDKELSAAAFAVKPPLIAAAGAARAAQITFITDRGQLSGDLAAVPSSAPDALRQSAKFLFAEFAEQQQLIAGARA